MNNPWHSPLALLLGSLVSSKRLGYSGIAWLLSVSDSRARALVYSARRRRLVKVDHPKDRKGGELAALVRITPLGRARLRAFERARVKHAELVAERHITRATGS